MDGFEELGVKLIMNSMEESNKITNSLIESYKRDSERGSEYREIIRYIRHHLCKKSFYVALSDFEFQVLESIKEALAWEDEGF